MKNNSIAPIDSSKNSPGEVMMGSWAENYRSWRDYNSVKKIIVKYEDLILNPYENFFKIISYLNKLNGLTIDEEMIKAAFKFGNDYFQRKISSEHFQNAKNFRLRRLLTIFLTKIDIILLIYCKSTAPKAPKIFGV